MKTTLRVLSLAALVLGTFWGTYALANGFRAPDSDPWYFVPQAAGFYLFGATGWAVLGALARLLRGSRR
ncbi:hypothetical protein [Truepera radiovictrix]|uniref:Integral membrane protein n=1 Tax=Truepera radiovictrix (strain DSM 17093 / CIP 108686 / LMG 22925 / RQ-24) TaxID=649638 RepID=D7CTJ3_TRURR|nr:hypothetical protein [Truepera radiovictrix]ADI13850.1 putative integral membrane protein [Truepera radiovictrix DSM 17093]WMT57586.1 hypothetical protein RCV51_01255 [Truepera radiovictrix]